ncbi:MAG: preprotein translocase subunit SecY, partial [Gemmatimonadaceae bacterium]
MAQSAPAAAVSNIYNTPELRDKIMFTLLCLVIYRIGAHVTAPGVDVVALTDFFANKGQGGLLGMYDLFVGGGLSRATVFALGIMPYISASIFIQIAGAVI